MRQFLRRAWDVIQMARGQDLAAAIRARSQRLDIQLAQMRLSRIAAEKELETRALQGVRESVDELQKLLKGMNAVEGAAIKFVEDVNVQARSQLEEELATKYETILSTVAQGGSIPDAVEKMVNKKPLGISRGANPDMELEIGTSVHYSPNLDGNASHLNSSSCIETPISSDSKSDHEVSSVGLGNRQRMKDVGER